MKCFKCSGSYKKQHGPLDIQDRYVGSMSVGSVDYYRCSGCNELLFSPKTARLIEGRREEIKDKLLRSQPLDDFLSASETASFLCISRQALHKHRRIRRGFIYKTTFDGRTVYLKKSVILYKDLGDGRFPLHELSKTSHIQQVINIIQEFVIGERGPSASIPASAAWYADQGVEHKTVQQEHLLH